MPGRPNRSTFLKGMTVAIGVGVVGVLFFKPDVNATSLSATVQDTDPITVVIPVQLVEKPGTDEWTVLVPEAEASPGDEIIWQPTTANIERIIFVRFKRTETSLAVPNPFARGNATIHNRNPEADRHMNKNVLDDADEGTYYYKIRVRDTAQDKWESPDPPIDIVPRGSS